MSPDLQRQHRVPGLRDVPGQQRELRELDLSHRQAHRHTRAGTRLRVRLIPRRPNCLDLRAKQSHPPYSGSASVEPNCLGGTRTAAVIGCRHGLACLVLDTVALAQDRDHGVGIDAQGTSDGEARD